LLKKESISHLSLRLFDRTVWLWRAIDRMLPCPPTSIIAVGIKAGGTELGIA
jgi:hypothetical protein